MKQETNDHGKPRINNNNNNNVLFDLAATAGLVTKSTYIHIERK